MFLFGIVADSTVTVATVGGAVSLLTFISFVYAIPLQASRLSSSETTIICMFQLGQISMCGSCLPPALPEAQILEPIPPTATTVSDI
jgi:hypothetical protein